MLEEDFYPRSRRFYLYLVSAAESLPLLIFAFVLKVIIFNLNGLIKQGESILYFPQIAWMSKKGGFLGSFQFKDQLLSIIMIFIVFKVNEFYMRVSRKSTQRENHRTNHDLNSSLVIKRFIFELINRFTHFFYIAFVIYDLQSLKKMLSTLFVMDEIRKIATESLIPWAVKLLASSKKQRKADAEVDT